MSEENASSVKRYLDKATALSPGLKEIRFEEARYYYQFKLDYQRALQLMEELSIQYPNDDEIVAFIGYVYRRMGDYKKSLEYNEKAISLSPSDWDYWQNAANTLRAIREYAKAEDYYKRTIDLISTPTGFDLIELWIATGQLQKARELLANHEEYFDTQGLKMCQSQVEFLDRNYEKALQIMHSLTEDAINTQLYYFTKHLQLGLMYRSVSDTDNSTRHFALERDHLTEKLKAAKNDHRLYSSLAIACAGLGLKEEALEAGKKALEIRGFEKDAHGGILSELTMVKLLVMTGDHDEAMVRLERIISRHGYLTADNLKIDPFWDPVRNHEKFKEIISNPAYQVKL